MNLNIITYVATLVAGILFVIFRQGTNLLNATNIIVALTFIVPGIINFVTALRSRRNYSASTITTLGLILVSAAAIVLGGMMIFMPEIFLPYIAGLIGVVLILCGIYQLNGVIRLSPKSKERWFMLTPALIMVCGIIVIALGDKGMNELCWIITGVILMAYSINGFIAMQILSSVKIKNNTDNNILIQ